MINEAFVTRELNRRADIANADAVAEEKKLQKKADKKVRDEAAAAKKAQKNATASSSSAR
jgi:hypothetical protein